MKHIPVFVCLLFLAPLAHAADIRVSCTGPTQYTDGTAIALGTPVSYKLYGGKTGETKTVLDTKTTCAFTRTNVAPGPAEYYVTATIANAESAPSNTGTINVPAPTPNAPAGISVTIQVTVSTP
jgi:hypothetical protein